MNVIALESDCDDLFVTKRNSMQVIMHGSFFHRLEWILLLI